MAGEEGGRAMFGATAKERAYFGPFFVFFGLFALGGLARLLFEGRAFWMVAHPEYWVYPLQVLIPGALLWHWRKEYELAAPQRVTWSVAIGLLALAVWIAPQVLLHGRPRLEGFDPSFFGGGAPYAANLTLRIVRLIVIVPLVEELFWRGFLLRYVIDPDFAKVPFGTITRASFAVVTIGFILEHQMADWPAAAVTGALYNLVAYRTRSLSSCVLAHAITNLFLGWYVLATRQWGFW